MSSLFTSNSMGWSIKLSISLLVRVPYIGWKKAVKCNDMQL
jgi:hypothetical protein